ncbi:MAG: ankyrin repeat domain-containing protein, partial [Planctomycetota bacterium]|nr:ankyrin repeat domain-containing protein [Planctomycetota bacterium]
MKKNDPRRSFWHAVHRGDLPALRAALKAGADPDQAFPLGKASATEGRLSPLLLAARCGQTEVCRELLAHGADVSGGHAVLTPLLEAAACGHAELVALFKRHKARGTFFTQVVLGEIAAAARALKKDPGLARAEDELGQTPLHYAARALNLKAIALLLKHGADPNAPSRRRVT